MGPRKRESCRIDSTSVRLAISASQFSLAHCSWAAQRRALVAFEEKGCRTIDVSASKESAQAPIERCEDVGLLFASCAAA